MATKFIQMSCICNASNLGFTSPRSHYPSMPNYPKGLSPSKQNYKPDGSESKAVFEVTGMTCSACSASVQKAVKRLPGIREAAVDVVSNRAHVFFYPSFVTVRDCFPCVYSCSRFGFYLFFSHKMIRMSLWSFVSAY